MPRDRRTENCLRWFGRSVLVTDTIRPRGQQTATLAVAHSLWPPASRRKLLLLQKDLALASAHPSCVRQGLPAARRPTLSRWRPILHPQVPSRAGDTMTMGPGAVPTARNILANSSVAHSTPGTPCPPLPSWTVSVQPAEAGSELTHPPAWAQAAPGWSHWGRLPPTECPV